MRLRIALSGLLLGALGLVSCVRQSVSGQPALSADDLEKLLAWKPRTVYLVDVRTPEEYASGHIPGAVNVPVDSLAAHPPTADKDALIVVYCRSGARSARARQALLDMGYAEVANFGGVSNWKGRLVTGDNPE